MKVSFHNWQDTTAFIGIVRALGQDDVQVWLAVEPGEGPLTEQLSILSPDERERAGRFRVEAPRREYIFARALLRQLLGACLNTAPEEIAFGCQPRGKPEIQLPASGRGFQFNLSHASGYVAVALSRRRRVGIDIEGERDDCLELAERVFSSNERQVLATLPASQRRAGFFKGWTSKEAYLKATGEGITEALQSIEVCLQPSFPPRLLVLPEAPEPQARWTIHAVPCPAGLAGAVVCEIV